MTRYPWLESSEGKAFLKKRLDAAVQAFLEDNLSGRLSEELEALLAPDSRDFRFGRSLRHLSEDLSILCLAESMHISTPESAWDTARFFIRLVSSIDEINFQGRTGNPKWNSDLTTAEVGVSLAVAMYLDAGKASATFGSGADRAEEVLRRIHGDCLANAGRPVGR